MSEPVRVALCLHGLLRTGMSMLRVRGALRSAGYAAVQCPTWRYELHDLDDLGSRVADLLGQLSADHDGAEVDVVTHSMGGLVLRASLRHGPPVRRAVMLAPPNQGAQVAAEVRARFPIHKLGWDPLAPLLPGRPAVLPTPDGRAIEVGVLAGSGTRGQLLARLLDDDSDGKVRVEEARLAGLSDFGVLPVGHTWIMTDDAALLQIRSFFERGTFARQADGELCLR